VTNSLNFFADFVLILHLAYILFVVGGGLLLFKWREIAWVHIPAVLWAAVVECAGWICPLTPLENWLRLKGGGTGYQGDFLQHYLVPILYPDNLTREMQLVLGILVLTLNMLMYFYVFLKRRPYQKS
jgi:hypothetical protein